MKQGAGHNLVNYDARLGETESFSNLIVRAAHMIEAEAA